MHLGNIRSFRSTITSTIVCFSIAVSLSSDGRAQTSSNSAVAAAKQALYAARQDIKAGDFAAAVLRLQSAITAVPNEPSLYVALGDAFAGEENYAEAVVAYKKATWWNTTSNPPNPGLTRDAYNRLGNSLAKMGQGRAAIEAYKTASRFDGSLGSSSSAQRSDPLVRQPDQRDALSAGRCNWFNDFSLIRDPEMLNTLRTQNFSQKLAQGGQSIDQQIAAGEAALQQITATLPNIEAGIRAMTSVPPHHFNFTFDYAATCKQNRGANQGTALLAEMCQHINVENTRYALNGTLQIMDCMAGRTIRADIGPNQDAPLLATEWPPEVQSAVVPVSTGDCAVQNSGDTYSPPPNPNCPHVWRPGDPKPGDKITH